MTATVRSPSLFGKHLDRFDHNVFESIEAQPVIAVVVVLPFVLCRGATNGNLQAVVDDVFHPEGGGAFEYRGVKRCCQRKWGSHWFRCHTNAIRCLQMTGWCWRVRECCCLLQLEFQVCCNLHCDIFRCSGFGTFAIDRDTSRFRAPSQEWFGLWPPCSTDILVQRCRSG